MRTTQEIKAYYKVLSWTLKLVLIVLSFFQRPPHVLYSSSPVMNVGTYIKLCLHWNDNLGIGISQPIPNLQ